MNILVLGSGGREHTIIRKLKESPRKPVLFAAPGNGGIAKDAICYPVNPCDGGQVVELAKKIAADLVVVTPDDPLVAGVVDCLQKAGFRTFGPDQKAAIIEGSKSFSKELMKKHGIPTAGFETFTDAQKAADYIRAHNTFPVVIKADGLALGKGVVIAQTLEEALEAVEGMMCGGRFGKSGETVVIEEFLTGPEVSVLAFCDGKNVRPMISSMDHKRALDGDLGLNTGGMGTVAPNPCYTQEIAAVCQTAIFEKTMTAMAAEGRPFKGCLYFGLMLTENGPKVIEYNCRFGDPETQVVLPLLETDLLDIFEAVENERLDQLEIRWNDGACACVVIASGGYPQSYRKGLPMTGLDENGQLTGCTVYHAGTSNGADGGFITNGGRVLGVTAVANTLQQALDQCYASVDKIRFDGAFYRHDIGHKALAAERNNA